MGLVRTLIVIILFYYGFKLLARFVFPFLAQILFNKVQRNMQDQFDRGNFQQRPEGEVTIKKNENNTSNNGRSLDAEDVDFEEIKE